MKRLFNGTLESIADLAALIETTLYRILETFVASGPIFYFDRAVESGGSGAVEVISCGAQDGVEVDPLWWTIFHQKTKR